MDLSEPQRARHALDLFRGARGQTDAEARRDAALGIAVQPGWSNADRAAVLSIFDELLSAKDDDIRQQEILAQRGLGA